ncbi:MAG: rhomboid family intramembrane serine protease [Planctomycetales bacterium]|nr:rhomboid family intramembrane serine protease [Planctomycetales bacterium]
MPTARQVPFTICLVIAVVAIAVGTGTHLGELGPDWLEHWGFAPQDLHRGDWRRIVSSVILTVGGWNFYAAVAMICTCVGAAERRFGTLATMAIFVSVHIATLILEDAAAVFPLRRLGHPLGDLLHVARDVGPSAGYYGCLGAVLAAIASPRRRWLMLAAVATLLGCRLIWSALSVDSAVDSLPADIAHVIALPAGAIWGVMLRRRARHRPPTPLEGDARPGVS